MRSSRLGMWIGAMALLWLWGAGCYKPFEVRPCQSDSQCPSGQRCVSQRCAEETRCQDDSQCKRTEVCVRGRCSSSAAACTDGQTQSCYSGPPQTRGIGACKDGSQLCSLGKWGPCQGAQLPGAEKCGDGIDDDCDGKIDENCSSGGCLAGEVRPCYGGSPSTRNIGQCKDGKQTCENGQWGPCAGEITPTTEKCNDGKDDDCNGKIDDCKQCNDGDTTSCYDGPQGSQGVGPCSAGTRTCVGGTWGKCAGQVLPTTELCGNGIDDDCNGEIDKNCKQCLPGQTRVCGTSSIGACRKGQQACLTSHMWGACLGEIKASPEICDGKDNDCNGYVDESFPDKDQRCASGQPGVCAQGSYQCIGGSKSCKPLYKPTREKCSNGKDEDCDGKIDNGCP